MENSPPSLFNQDTLIVTDDESDIQAVTDEIPRGPIFTEEEADRLGIVLDEHGRHVPEDSAKTKEWFDKRW